MIALAERRAKTLDLRRQGRRFEEIAARLGISDSTAHRDVSVAMAQITAEPAMHLLQLELLRLDDLQRAFHNRACEGDIVATNMCLRILDQRAKLLGLYPDQGRGQSVGKLGVSVGADPLNSDQPRVSVAVSFVDPPDYPQDQ
jgi:hypothetical protein